jgi:DNA-binding GntR family transcriptional regulator
MLKNLHRKLKGAARSSDLQSWSQNNILFHDFFVENSGNNDLRQMTDTLKRRVTWYHYMLVLVPGQFKAYIEHHEGILKAYETNDGEMAERFMKLHI